MLLKAYVSLCLMDMRILSTTQAGRTVIKIMRGLEGDVNGNGGVQHGGGLAEAALPGDVVRQLPQRIGHAAQVNATITLPGTPCHLPIWRAHSTAPRPQRIRMCLHMSMGVMDKLALCGRLPFAGHC